MEYNGIVVKTGRQPGKTLAVFGGVHGNETVGVMAVKKSIESFDIKRGTVYFVIANPEAVKRNVRFVEKNLNRLFLKNNIGQSIEDKRAKELMTILDECDALIDLHASNSEITKPFIITKPSFFDIASYFNINIVSYGWGKFESGATEEYMFAQDKPGFCIECGSVFRPDDNLNLAVDCVRNFLNYFGAIEDKKNLQKNDPTYIEIVGIGIKKTDSFRFTKDFNDFDLLPIGEVFAEDGSDKYVAGSDECIIFPRPDKPIGGEVFIIGKKIDSNIETKLAGT